MRGEIFYLQNTSLLNTRWFLLSPIILTRACRHKANKHAKNKTKTLIEGHLKNHQGNKFQKERIVTENKIKPAQHSATLPRTGKSLPIFVRKHYSFILFKPLLNSYYVKDTVLFVTESKLGLRS